MITLARITDRAVDEDQNRFHGLPFSGAAPIQVAQAANLAAMM